MCGVERSAGAVVSAFAHYEPTNTSLAVNHQGQFPSVTLSFNLAPGVSLGDAVDAIEQCSSRSECRPTVHATFQGTAQAFQDFAGERAAT